MYNMRNTFARDRLYYTYEIRTNAHHTCIYIYTTKLIYIHTYKYYIYIQVYKHARTHAHSFAGTHTHMHSVILVNQVNNGGVNGVWGTLRYLAICMTGRTIKTAGNQINLQ